MPALPEAERRLNIFDPRRIQDLNVNSDRPDVRPGANGARPDNADPAAETKRQLGDAMGTRAELEFLLQTLEQTPGAPKEEHTSADSWDNGPGVRR